jgi:prepilin-type N-terminal cleavage/methylation domain-containing protein
MRRNLSVSMSGFTLVEMMVSLALGLIVVGSAVQIFSKGMDATFLVQQRSEMQQDVRSAESMLVNDISMAGAGLPAGGLALISGTGTKPTYGCDPTNGCKDINKTGINFPTQTSNGVTTYYLYAIIPGYAKGPTLNATQGATDAITVAYTDPNVSWGNYQVTFTGTSTATATVSGTDPASSVSPKLNDAGYGLKVGDLVWITGNRSGSTIYAIGEVTGISGASSPYTVSFATTDSMSLNQTGGTSGLSSLVSPSTACPTPKAGVISCTITRILLITYSLDSSTDGAGNVTYRLIRQVNGQAPVPLVENVSDLRFRYDIYNDALNPPTQTNTTDALMSSGGSVNLIRKVDIAHLTIRSPIAGTAGYQGIDIQTSVAARNLAFSDRYPGPNFN